MDKDTICNHIVQMAADLMEKKIIFNEGVIEQFVESGRESSATVLKLREDNSKTRAAIEHMRTQEGCWA